MKKPILALLLFLSIFLIGLQLVNAQDFHSLAMKSKTSLNGLEASDYKKLPIKIYRKGSERDKIGLTEERIRTKCELRLRQSGLQPVDSKTPFDECLDITIQILPQAFAIEIHFLRVVLFEVKGVPYFIVAPTWENGGTGSHGGESEFIIKSLDQQLEVFLNEYLKANVK